MNRIFLFTILALLTAHTSFSQGFYINPRVGAGFSGQRWAFSNPTATGKVATTGGVYAGYTIKGFRIGTGIAVLNTGHKATGLVFADGFNPSTGQSDPVDIVVSDMQIIIPVTFAYVFAQNKKVSIAPELSLGPGFYAGSTIKKTSTTTGEVTKDKLTGLGSVSLYGQMSVHLIYKLNKNIGITLTPTYAHELNSVFNGGSTVSGIFPIGNYAMTGSAGVIVEL